MRQLVLGVIVLAAGCKPVSAAPAPHASNAPASADVADVVESAESAESADPSARHPLGVLGRYFARGDDYELDDLDRSGPERGKKPICPREAIVAYGGKTIRYEAPASVHRAFAERLARFDAVVAAVAIEVYGRSPRLLHHAGGYMCRTSWRGRMSEHAFGNALDVAGFTFPAISKDDLARARARGLDLGPAQRRSFRIDVGETWRPTGGPEAKRFFALLLERVRARDDLFRGMIGPPDPAHTTHLHLDAGPWSFSRYIPPG